MYVQRNKIKLETMYTEKFKKLENPIYETVYVICLQRSLCIRFHMLSYNRTPSNSKCTFVFNS